MPYLKGPFLFNIFISDWSKGMEEVTAKAMTDKMRVQKVHDRLE